MPALSLLPQTAAKEVTQGEFLKNTVFPFLFIAIS